MLASLWILSGKYIAISFAASDYLIYYAVMEGLVNLSGCPLYFTFLLSKISFFLMLNENVA